MTIGLQDHISIFQRETILAPIPSNVLGIVTEQEEYITTESDEILIIDR